MKRTRSFLLMVACILVLPLADASANGNGRHDGNRRGDDHDDDCDNCAGGKIGVQYCFDQDRDGECGPIDNPIDNPIYLYNNAWEILRVNITGRDDGDVWNEQDRGVTAFLGLVPGRYIVCAYGAEEFFTYPTAASPDPSSRIAVVERATGNNDESRYCFEVEVAPNEECDEDDEGLQVYFSWFVEDEV